MTPTKTNKPKGISFIDGLQLLFIALKLTDFIAWSWFLVLLPHIIKHTVAVCISITEERQRQKNSK